MARGLFANGIPSVFSNGLPPLGTISPPLGRIQIIPGDSPQQNCPPTMRVGTNMGLQVDAPVQDVSDMLDKALEEQVWTEVARTETSTEVNGVTITRIDTVSFQRPSGEITRLVFNHPPIQST